MKPKHTIHVLQFKPKHTNCRLMNVYSLQDVTLSQLFKCKIISIDSLKITHSLSATQSGSLTLKLILLYFSIDSSKHEGRLGHIETFILLNIAPICTKSMTNYWGNLRSFCRTEFYINYYRLDWMLTPHLFHTEIRSQFTH